MYKNNLPQMIWAPGAQSDYVKTTLANPTYGNPGEN